MDTNLTFVILAALGLGYLSLVAWLDKRPPRETPRRSPGHRETKKRSGSGL